ncbi:MAG: pyridoxamine 5'-phosphate oxidase family protein [Bacteroidales bacterium]|nr:pyridoxamine 5'-phosphate oxidase family protein [Bacteroidales bacterium]
MGTETNIKKYIEDVFQTNNLAVLATEGNGQPHASLVAVTPIDGFVHLFFATYRSTRKYNNLISNEKVAILFEKRYINNLNQHEITALTAFGVAKEVDKDVYDMAIKAHLTKHPEQDEFLLSEDCAVFLVYVNAYQLVLGINDVKWWHIIN